MSFPVFALRVRRDYTINIAFLLPFTIAIFICWVITLNIVALRKKCPSLVLFWSAFSPIRREYGCGKVWECGRLVQMWENADQSKPEYGTFYAMCHWNHFFNAVSCNAVAFSSTFWSHDKSESLLQIDFVMSPIIVGGWYIC